MKENKTLLSYILGACTIVIFLPIVEELVNVTLSWIEYLKILPGKLVIKGNAELQESYSQIQRLKKLIRVQLDSIMCQKITKMIIMMMKSS